MDVLIFGLQIIACLVIITGIALMEDVGLQLASIGILALFVLTYVEVRMSDR